MTRPEKEAGKEKKGAQFKKGKKKVKFNEIVGLIAWGGLERDEKNSGRGKSGWGIKRERKEKLNPNKYAGILPTRNLHHLSPSIKQIEPRRMRGSIFGFADDQDTGGSTHLLLRPEGSASNCQEPIITEYVTFHKNL